MIIPICSFTRVPLVSHVIFDMVLLGAQAAAVVAPATPEHETSVIVFMIGNEAIQNFGPMLKLFAQEHPQQESERRLILQPDQSLKWITRHMADEKQNFAWFNFKLENHSCLVAAFHGNDICEELAPRLNAVGIVTNLR